MLIKNKQKKLKKNLKKKLKNKQRKSNLNIISADSLTDAAKRSVDLTTLKK